MSTPLKTLIAKLNPVCRKATERAASHCFARGHYEVDLEHLFLALLDESTGDVPLVLRASGVDPHALRADLERELERLKTGNTRTPVFSVHLSELFEQAWLIASLDSQIGRIRSGHLLLALLTGPDLAQFAQRMSSQFARVRVDDLKHKFDEIAAGSSEAEPRHADADVAVPDGAAASGDAPRGPSKTPALDTYTTNLTQRAREGKIDPVIGRDAEIRQAIDILMRRRQNNPIMTGEAGVGKTAVVEGLALRIAADDVPPPLRGVALHVLDMGLLQAGASVKGEFENRLKSVIDEVKKSAHPIILFIDEAHTIIGAGGQAGQNDAANLLKPALARGELRTIAATTWSEYKKYFEKDAALARRFQVVKIEEPSEPLAAAMLRGMAALMERHFNVRVLDDAITEAVRLSHRYISGRQLPDKAISVLDTACAKVALAHSSTPAAIDDAKKRIERIDAEIAALEREAASGAAHDARLAELREARDADLKALAEDAARYEEERALVTEIGALRAELDAARESSADGKPVDVDATRAKLAERVDALRARQGNQPMVPLQVDGHVVAEIVASWTGIPLGRMVKDEIETVLNLRDLLGARVIGQDHALGAIAQRVRTATANLEDPNKPRGVFMFVGPSGVGKTETALALADVLYGGERKMITINMSEYQEAHSVSGLKGSPPGYVGYGEGGVLTEAVRRNPYSVVLLDEVEKAHPDVLEMFFQVFDKGAMDDAEGREIDFRNTLIILTSNVGSSAVMQACLNKAPQELPDAETLAETLRPQLYKTFKPAFLGRMKVIPYYPISDDVLAEIIELKLERIRRRIEANHKAAFEWDESLVDAVLARCTEVDSGARNVDHILNGTLLPEIAEHVLSRIADGEAIVRIAARAAETGEFEYTVE
ncbi:type VI secretion system ATPase TssH [Burkholderia pseudomallei]|uniref:Type VI secretion ATPase, ClpV1 family n=1 Tax=Burkholderia pseudomallei TaxID=28450 RepID=A0AA40J9Y9_BURPE|nr:type VI secretion system ATPase TssH [Burkholderia pseudomallei]AHE27383.1 type VI secretion ATPase, ClpV1 family [Burkholderia pseudomallei NCTC 13178]AIV50016.1 type VI secretion ATPase, ClpV1 family [Burkholderia pseudomallei MSHR1153]KGC51260.1 type VI secretion ATPase, ClpV1 family [Burkholderia pseudomallei]KGD52966.1 type VI secretion ATPase, ClpV1 family [Burkholderia pseudomallei]KGV60465.1 type VI secretion ATPase, ClpV1 family [Burkholderia pseudomallei ABCPW 91]